MPPEPIKEPMQRHAGDTCPDGDLGQVLGPRISDGLRVRVFAPGMAVDLLAHRRKMVVHTVQLALDAAYRQRDFVKVGHY